MVHNQSKYSLHGLTSSGDRFRRSEDSEDGEDGAGVRAYRQIFKSALIKNTEDGSEHSSTGSRL